MRYDIVAGDLTPPLGLVLQNGGKPAPLVGASIIFTMQQADGPKRVQGPATIDDLATATVHYDWQGHDTDVPGVYRAQFKAVFPSLEPETFPSDEDLYVIIHPSV